MLNKITENILTLVVAVLAITVGVLTKLIHKINWQIVRFKCQSQT